MKGEFLAALCLGFLTSTALCGGDPPSLALSHFCQGHLDEILAPIDANVPMPRGDVMGLRQSFIAWMAKAPANEQTAWRAAIGVCDALNNAMDERDKARANMDSSSAVHGATDLGAHRKDHPKKWEYKREKDEAAQRAADGAQKDAFLNSTLRSNWNQRALQLRQNLMNLQTRLQQLELQSQDPNSQVASAATDTITLQKATPVTVKYGSVTLPAGTALHVVSRHPKGITVEYNGELVIVPPQ